MARARTASSAGARGGSGGAGSERDLSGGGDAGYRLPRLGDRIDKSPLELYLPSLNLVLVGLTTMIGVLGRRDDEGLGTLYALLPAGVLVLVVVVKWEIGNVDVGGLEGLRYSYKGA